MAEASRTRTGRAGGFLTWATWAYAGVVLAALAMIRGAGDVWWPATVLLFLPRWLFLAPIGLLAVAAGGWGNRGLWATQGAIALVVAGPLMAGSLPISRFGAGAPVGPRFRIMTFNLGQGAIDSAGITRLIEAEGIDLVCFQEVRKDAELESFFARGWSRDQTGAIASRLAIVAEYDPVKGWDGVAGFWTRRVARVRVRSEDGDEFVVASAHVPTMREGLLLLKGKDLDGFRRHLEWRREQMEALRIELDETAQWPELVGGDLNTPTDSLLLDPLRARFAFAFERAGWGYGYTRPTALPWTRIDHILASPQWVVTRCWVGPDLGSDHLPVIAEVVLPAAAESGAR